MKSWLESLLIALSMYSAIPVKCLNWTEKNLRNAMVFFPLVGLLCGVGLWLVWLPAAMWLYHKAFSVRISYPAFRAGQEPRYYQPLQYE